MKKLLIQLICISIIALSCKKDKSNPPEASQTELKKEELIPYYIAVEHKISNNKIGLIYFTKEGSNVKAVFQGDGYTHTGDISVNKQSFSFDVNQDGNYVYSFSLDRDADGKYILKFYQFTDKTSVSQGLNYAIIARKEDVPVFENVNFITTGNIFFSLKKDVNNVPNINWNIKERITYTTIIIPPNSYQQIPNLTISPEFSRPYTKINGLGWKDSGGFFFGIAVPKWKNSTNPLMLLEKENMLYLAAVTQKSPGDD